MYKIILDKQVRKFLKSHKDVLKRFYYSLEKIYKDPFESSLDIKKIVGRENHYRLRIGKYRFLYEVREKEIIIYFFKANSRGDIYK